MLRVFQASVVASGFFGLSNAIRKDYKSSVDTALGVGTVSQQIRVLLPEDLQTGSVFMQVMGGLQLKSEETPDVTDNLQTVLKSTITEIENVVETQIKDNHKETQTSVTSKFEGLELTVDSTIANKTSAVGAATAWDACRVSEMELQNESNTELTNVHSARSATVEPCRKAANASRFVWAVPSLAHFTCSIGAVGSCDDQLNDFNAKLDDVLNSLKRELDEAATVFTSWTNACVTARRASEDQIIRYNNSVEAYQEKVKVCRGMFITRSDGICAFGEALQIQCGKAIEFNSFVSGWGNEQQDRQNDWKSASVIKCLLNGVVQETDELTTKGLELCERNVDYARDVGTLDLKNQALENLLGTTDACDASSISFTGFLEGNDNVPSSEEVDWSPPFNGEHGQPPFPHCAK